MNEEDKIALQNEIDILTQVRFPTNRLQVDHPNIVKLYEVFEEENFYYLVIELMTGGELFDQILEKEFFSE